MTTKETLNYVWDTSLGSILGRGMMGTVYKGFSKGTGEQVAIKTLNRNTPEAYQERELDLLRRIKNENILKLLAVEEEKVERKPVMILELCTGGSLLSYLQEPENCYGLPEDEVLLVLEHLKNGIKYLRENNILHRDLKPGNIMRHVGEDGRSIFKLADFDAARQLQEGQEFESIFGTPAYLDPSLYEQQFITGFQTADRKFSASTDLWSIGVTLYQVVTGRLPFVPFEGAETFKMMHHITTKKPSGAISGVQTTTCGNIDWRTDLPEDCLLSEGLQKLFTPLLATLLEAEVRKRCTYNDFFQLSEDLVNRKRLHVFYVNGVQPIRLYLHSQNQKTLADLQLAVQEQTDIAPENQLLLFKDSALKSFIEQRNSFSFPRTTQDNPILLCHRDENNVIPKWKLSALRFLIFPNQLNFVEDGKIAKHNAVVGYVYKRQLELINRSICLFNSTALTINQVVISQLVGVSREVLQIKSVINSLEHQFKMMETFHKSCRSFIPLIPRKANSFEQNSIDCLTTIVNSMGESFVAQKVSFEALKERLQQLNPALAHLLSNRVENHSLVHDWEELIGKIPESNSVMTTAVTLVHKIHASYNNLNPDPFAPGHTHKQSHDNQVLHLTERLLMQEKCKNMHRLLGKQYKDIFLTVVKNFSDWYKTAQVATIQPEILTQDLIKLRNTLADCELQLNSSVEKFQSQLDKFTDGLRKSYAHTELKSAIREKGSKPTRKDCIKELVDELKQLVVVQQELKKSFLFEDFNGRK